MRSRKVLVIVEIWALSIMFGVSVRWILVFICLKMLPKVPITRVTVSVLTLCSVLIVPVNFIHLLTFSFSLITILWSWGRYWYINQLLFSFSFYHYNYFWSVMLYFCSGLNLSIFGIYFSFQWLLCHTFSTTPSVTESYFFQHKFFSYIPSFPNNPTVYFTHLENNLSLILILLLLCMFSITT